MNVIWTDDEKDFVRQHAASMTDTNIAAALTNHIGREVTTQAARKQRQKMKLKKCRGRGICKLVDSTKVVPAKPKGVAFHIHGNS